MIKYFNIQSQKLKAPQSFVDNEGNFRKKLIFLIIIYKDHFFNNIRKNRKWQSTSFTHILSLVNLILNFFQIRYNRIRKMEECKSKTSRPINIESNIDYSNKMNFSRN